MFRLDAATEPLSVFVIVITLSPLPTVEMPVPCVIFNASLLLSAVAVVPDEGTALENILRAAAATEPLSVLTYSVTIVAPVLTTVSLRPTPALNVKLSLGPKSTPSI